MTISKTKTTDDVSYETTSALTPVARSPSHSTSSEDTPSSGTDTSVSSTSSALPGRPHSDGPQGPVPTAKRPTTRESIDSGQLDSTTTVSSAIASSKTGADDTSSRGSVELVVSDVDDSLSTISSVTSFSIATTSDDESSDVEEKAPAPVSLFIGAFAKIVGQLAAKEQIALDETSLNESSVPGPEQLY